MMPRIIEKTLIFTLMIVILSTLSLASSPDYKVSHLLEEDVNNGYNNIGNLLFVELSYTPETVELETIEDYDVERYDKMIWRGERSVIIKDPDGNPMTIIPGDSYQFMKKGEHTIQNSSETDDSSGIIMVRSEPDNNITISESETPSGMKLNFSENDVELDDEKTVGVGLEVDDDLKPDNYTVKYVINDEEYSHDVKVNRNYNWSLNHSRVNKTLTARSGEEVYLGRALINNTGNMKIEVESNVEDDDKNVIVMSGSRTLYRNSKAFFDIEAQVPSVFEAGVYDYNIEFTGGGLSRNFTTRINVTDKIKPEIKTINFSTERAFEDNDITVVATDNDEVSNLSLSYDNKTEYFERDGNVFSKTVNFQKLSMYELMFCARDESDNEDCVNVNKTFEKANIIEGYKDVIEMPTVKQGKYSSSELFNITEDLDDGVEILIRSVETVDSDYDIEDIGTFRITNDDGSIKRFGSSNRKVTVKEAGSYNFEVRSNEDVDIEGVLRFSIPEKYSGIDDVTFKSSFKDYDVPEDFSKSWFNDQELECVVNETGDLKTTNRVCTFKIPVSVKKDDISVPMTISQKEEIDSKIHSRDGEIRTLKGKQSTLMIIGSIVIVLFSISTYYIVYIKPYTRFKMGETKEELQNRSF